MVLGKARLPKLQRLPRNCQRNFCPELLHESSYRPSTELRPALNRGQFSVHYQPRVDLGTGEITSVAETGLTVLLVF
jgi:hypothetical protein